MTSTGQSGTGDEAIVGSASSYDAMPYSSHPFAQTHPARMAAVARVCGLDTPDPTRARVLELGCAAGGNLIPIAARLPQSQILRVDLSACQIADGRGRIERLGLRNIELRHADLTEFGLSEGVFDYIICHGVYSWAPAPAREAILRICGEILSPTGVAYVSYNVLPGWRLRQTLRDALALSLTAPDTLPVKVGKARELIAHLAEHTPAASNWGRIFRAEAAALANMPDDYLGHEFLEDCNEPCSFTQFASDAARYGLSYLVEAHLSAILPETAFPSSAGLMRRLAGDDVISAQQNIDIFTGRTFRQTLLIHSANESAIKRRLDPRSIETLHVRPGPDFGFRGETNGRAVFANDRGARIETASQSCRGALDRLLARAPGSSTQTDLLAALAEEDIACGPVERAAVPSRGWLKFEGGVISSL